jgi:Methyltransferase domain.
VKIKLEVSEDDLYKLNIRHSSRKWVSKVSIKDTEKYLNIIKNYLRIKNNKKYYLKKIDNKSKLSILCLGVRNGREVDLFRLCQSNYLLVNFLKLFEISRNRIGFKTLFWSFLESLNRSDIDNLNQGSVIGIDINPKSKRKDVDVQSFDNIHQNLKKKFDIIYTNSLDHTANPYKVAAEMKSCLKDSGFIILAFPLGQDSGIIDPTSGIELDDIKKLFGGEIIYHKYESSSWYYTEYNN